MPRRRALLLAALAASTLAACRDTDLCVKTVQNVCVCDDPLQPNLDSCVASDDVVSCEPGATVDPCLTNPCCRIARGDGGAGDASAGDAARPEADAQATDAAPTD